MRIVRETDVVSVRQRARQIADLLGFDGQDQTRIATAVSEVARNAYEYTRSGDVEFFLREEDSWIFCVEIRDQGKGIEKLNEILRGQYVSPQGMGVGLLGAKKLMDTFSVTTGSSGTTVVLGKKPVKAPRLSAPNASAEVSKALGSLRFDDPLTELSRQNHELVETLERMQAQQEELRNLNDELENTNRGVVALYSELDEKAEALKRANQVKTRFLSNVTHEFRTPVNSIMNLTRLLIDGFEGPLEDSQRKTLEMIAVASTALSEMINDLLDLAKVEAGKLSVRPEDVDVPQLFASLRSLFRPLLGSSTSVQLLIEDPTDTLMMFTDGGKVSQILRNFISNALKYTERGEIRVSVRPDGPDFLLFSVADTGIGIATKDQSLIFEEFVQIESSLQKKNKGTGLGLSLTRRMAELLGGTVSVESAPGLGSTFYARLPLFYSGPREATYVTPETPAAELPKILIIDDDREDRSKLRELIDSVGRFEFFEAIDGITGYEVARKAKPDFIFLDLVMPNQNGVEFLMKLRANDHRTVPVIVHSSSDVSAMSEVFRRLEVSGFIDKMASAEEKVLRISRYLQGTEHSNHSIESEIHG